MEVTFRKLSRLVSLLERGITVNLYKRLSLRWPVWILLAMGLWILSSQSEPVHGQPPSREQQIREMQQRIEELSKKVEALRRANGPTTTSTAGAPDGVLSPEWIKGLNWRSIGPASMGGRITAISVFEADPCLYYVATASGGLLKTVNNGITFEHQFDRESTVSTGDVCVAPSDRNIVWVGTGEANPRNSVSYGDGVYKSTDGGKTWKNMGLKKSFQIGRIRIHPANPNIVYVGALGRLYGPNEERGLFKTTDGGATWDKVLYVDDKTGVIDIQMHPADPETLLVATYERLRDGFDTHPGESTMPDGYDSYDPIKKWGPGAGIYKTTDGGKTFKKLTQGLPTCQLGRIGLDYYRKDPKIVFAVIDSEKIGMGTPPAGEVYLGVAGKDADAGAKLEQITPSSPASKAGLQPGDVILSVNNKTILSYNQLVEQLKGKKAGDKLSLKVARKQEAKDIVVILENRPARQTRLFGGSANRPYTFMYSGQQPNVQDKQGPDSFQYGGVYKSTDGGESWTRVNSLNPRPMYFSQIRVDPLDDKNVYVLGIALYRSTDGGKTFHTAGDGQVHPDQHALWINPRDSRHMIIGCDGGFYVTYDRMANWDFLNHLAIGQFYHVSVDNRRPYNVYGGLQDNSTWGGPSRSLRGSGPVNDDWFVLGGGDGFVCRVDAHDPDIVYWEFQDGMMFRYNLRTGENVPLIPRPREGANVRINWKAPFFISLGNLSFIPFTPNLIRERYRFNWNTPYILSSHNSHIFYCGGNYVFRSLKQGSDLRPISPEITRTKNGSATALAESPRNPDVLYAGTDDGYLWATRNGGITWTNITDKVGLPGPRWVASIEASRFLEGRAYVVFDAHRSDDEEPYVYVTEDFGQTWKSLRANLPTGPTRVLREDVDNSSLLYLGTEFACWVSVDRGRYWTKLNNNLPTVAVHEIAVHPTAGEIVAATHGRSLWVLDVTPLRQMTPDVLKAKAHLYRPNTAVRWRSEPVRNSPYGVGARRFTGQNPPSGAQIYYSLTKKADKINLKVMDYAGKAIVEYTKPKADPGLHRIDWNLRRLEAVPAGQAQGAPPGLFRFGQAVSPGIYRVVLTVDGQEFSQPLHVEADPTVPNAVAAPEMPKEEKDEHDHPKDKQGLRIDD
jgi:photosystem II stability/assembly factor-like uncharacterized protein